MGRLLGEGNKSHLVSNKNLGISHGRNRWRIGPLRQGRLRPVRLGYNWLRERYDVQSVGGSAFFRVSLATNYLPVIQFAQREVAAI